MYCPECESKHIATERRLNGESKCLTCNFSETTAYFVAHQPTQEDVAFKELECKLEESFTHPLLNPNSPHYKMADGVEAIERMELMFSTVELLHWAKITAMKYRLRIGNKDGVESDAKKIETYENYYKYLEKKINAK